MQDEEEEENKNSCVKSKKNAEDRRKMETKTYEKEQEKYWCLF